MHAPGSGMPARTFCVGRDRMAVLLASAPLLPCVTPLAPTRYCRVPTLYCLVPTHPGPLQSYQTDWEAILESSPQRFLASVAPWMYPPELQHAARGEGGGGGGGGAAAAPPCDPVDQLPQVGLCGGGCRGGRRPGTGGAVYPSACMLGLPPPSTSPYPFLGIPYATDTRGAAHHARPPGGPQRTGCTAHLSKMQQQRRCPAAAMAAGSSRQRAQLRCEQRVGTGAASAAAARQGRAHRAFSRGVTQQWAPSLPPSLSSSLLHRPPCLSTCRDPCCPPRLNCSFGPSPATCQVQLSVHITTRMQLRNLQAREPQPAMHIVSRRARPAAAP